MMKGKRLHQMMCSQSINYQKIYFEKKLKDSSMRKLKYGKPVKFDEASVLMLEDHIKKFLNKEFKDD